MKAVFLASALALLSTIGSVNGSVGAGGCPNFVGVDYDETMASSSAVYLHAVDTLIYNGFSLGMLIGSSSYETLDCKAVPADTFTSLDNATFTDYTSRLADASNYAVTGAVTYYDSTTGTFLIQACVDITNLSIFLAAFAASGGTIPDSAMTALSIATYLLSVVHFQAAVVASQTRDYTTTQSDAITAFMATAPGQEDYAYLTECDVTVATCPSL